ncbi:hypothetical protein ACFLX8_01540 [Chloroflexota bacterium]
MPEDRCLLWYSIEYEVEKREGTWQEPKERHFHVRTKGNKLFNLCYNETEKDWSLTELVRS